MKKQIKQIPGFPGYVVSNYGEVYSFWEGSGPAAKIGLVMKSLKVIISGGRCQVNLRKDKKSHTRRVHRLVLEAFVGPCPRGMECCHFPDRSTLNNRLDNLRWDTKASNYRDRVSHKTCNRGTRNGSSKLKPKQVIAIRDKKRLGHTYQELANEYNVSLSTIQQICERKTWKWL